MEARVVIKNEDTFAVRLADGTYSVFVLKTPKDIEVGDLMEGQLTNQGEHILHHQPSDSFVEVYITLARTPVAAKTKQWLTSEVQRYR